MNRGSLASPQAYGPATAAIYGALWGSYASAFGDALLSYLDHTSLPYTRVLDMGCGTGELVRRFAARGSWVLGVDASQHMLNQAEALNLGDDQRANFIRADIRAFNVNRSFDIVTSSYNTLNHVSSLNEFESCIANAANSLVSGGLLAFDLNTQIGLEEWDRVKVTDRTSFLVVSRGVFDREARQAWKKFSGFYATEDGRYERFEELITNIAFPIVDVVEILRACGFRDLLITTLSSNFRPVVNPEKQDRIVVVARFDADVK